jgi:hypothetical protein
MALDHYVSQVHLKRFYSLALDELMYAMRKSDMKRFTPRSQAVCRIDEGNTNEYLTEPRAIEEFLKTIERKYNAAVAVLEDGKPDKQAIYAIAGFAAYVMTCSPAAMRINSGPLRELVARVAIKANTEGAFAAPPESLGGEGLAELLKGEKLTIQIDPKFPQAVGIANILDRVARFGNCHWDILKNEEPESPYFTSDYPVANELSSDPSILYRVLPLTPAVAIRIRPTRNRDQNVMSFEFPKFTFSRRYVRKQEAISINRLLVRSAEDTVFFRDDQPWVPRFIEKNRHFRVDTEVINASVSGVPAHFRQAVVAFQR